MKASDELNIGNATSGDKRKVRSNKQALSEIANGLKALAETSQKNQQNDD